ncbi:hypothetical protein EDB84DRAFT_1441336 [Lactarius hengduanensis]|nr:hypothetical protein EDB84DRAFT_1441336 [Lactarius hengduanensis]
MALACGLGQKREKRDSEGLVHSTQTLSQTESWKTRGYPHHGYGCCTGWEIATPTRTRVTRTRDPSRGKFWDEDQLTAELRLHPAFETVPFIVEPHWLTHPNNIRDATATVGFAIEDPTGAVVQAAMAGPISMFSYQVKFVPCGDNRTLIQCGRCHMIGHRTNDKSCKWRVDQIRCHRCGRDHHIDDHHFECPNQHEVPGICKCKYKCLLCGAMGHDARSRKCAKRGDFPAPRLAKVAGRDSPPPPAQKGKGKEARIDDIPDVEALGYVDWGAEPTAGGWGDIDPETDAASKAFLAGTEPAPPHPYPLTDLMGKPPPPKARRVTKATDTAKPGESSTDRANQRRTAIHAAGPQPIPAKSYDAADLQGRTIGDGKDKALRAAGTRIAQSTPKHLTEEILAAERLTAARVAEQSVPGIMKPQRISASQVVEATSRLAAINAEDLNAVLRIWVKGDLWEADHIDVSADLFALRLRESRYLRRIIKEDATLDGTASPSPPPASALLAECPTST